MKVVSATFLTSATRPSHYPDGLLPEVAFAGRSNVGKSSLINRLVSRKRLANISAVPGKTRLINFFTINDKLRFVDLPGYGYAKVPLSVKEKWGPMVESYLHERENLRLVVMILDIRRDPYEDDLALVRWFQHFSLNFIFVLTKTDKISKNQIKLRRKKIAGFLDTSDDDDTIVLFSSKTGEGKERLWKKIIEAVTG